MAYQHPTLALALGWKWNHAQGICTSEGWLTQWPVSLGAFPTDGQLAQWIAEYEAYLSSAQSKDDELQRYLDSVGGRVTKAIAGVLIDKGVCTMNDLRAKYRSMP